MAINAIAVLALEEAMASAAQAPDPEHPDDDMICGACGARYLPDRLALECEVCAAEDHTLEWEF